jgi:hypothetical protein
VLVLEEPEYFFSSLKQSTRNTQNVGSPAILMQFETTIYTINFALNFCSFFQTFFNFLQLLTFRNKDFIEKNLFVVESLGEFFFIDTKSLKKSFIVILDSVSLIMVDEERALGKCLIFGKLDHEFALDFK